MESTGLMKETKYSVLMSVYKEENPQYFKESIESMVQQTLPPDEIVIVKDGELTDELESIIRSYSKKEPELFTIVPLKENVGLGKALNVGLKKCRNELVARMDTDDISVKERCEIQVQEFLNNPHLSIVGSFIAEFNNNPNEITSSRIVPTKHKDIVKFSRRRSPFNHPTVMYKKSEVLRNKGYKNYRRNQDLDLFVRMLHNGAQTKNIDKFLVLFRANEDNLKRRKSWEKCRSYIEIIYHFWRSGYSSFLDVMIVASSQILIFLAPRWFLKQISVLFLRRTPEELR